MLLSAEKTSRHDDPSRIQDGFQRFPAYALSRVACVSRENSIFTLAKWPPLCYNITVAWSGIEVVITALTRNQVTGNRPWVRIPPAPQGPPTGGLFVLKEKPLQQENDRLGWKHNGKGLIGP